LGFILAQGVVEEVEGLRNYIASVEAPTPPSLKPPEKRSKKAARKEMTRKCCAKCGEELPSDARFCPNCGTPVRAAYPKPSQEQIKPPKPLSLRKTKPAPPAAKPTTPEKPKIRAPADLRHDDWLHEPVFSPSDEKLGLIIIAGIVGILLIVGGAVLISTSERYVSGFIPSDSSYIPVSSSRNPYQGAGAFLIIVGILLLIGALAGAAWWKERAKAAPK